MQVIVPIDGAFRHSESKIYYPRSKNCCVNGCLTGKSSCKVCYNNKLSNVGLDSFTRICMYSDAITPDGQLADFQEMTDSIFNPGMYERVVRYLIHDVGLDIKIDETKVSRERVLDANRTMVLDLPKLTSAYIYLPQMIDDVVQKRLLYMVNKEAVNLRESGDKMNGVIDPEPLQLSFTKKLMLGKAASFCNRVTSVSLNHSWCRNFCVPGNFSDNCLNCPIPEVRALVTIANKFPAILRGQGHIK